MKAFYLKSFQKYVLSKHNSVKSKLHSQLEIKQLTINCYSEVFGK